MATPIKITPTLYGESSRRFNKILLENSGKKISNPAKTRIQELVKKIVPGENK
jgi:hypothetical protein